MENPFSLKFGQVFTGFGVGCGIGVGVGRPIYFGAIPVLQPVLSATSGATDALSGVVRHANDSLKKIGMKGIEAGIGCGVGIGHGFGVGIALKPWVFQQIQTSITESVMKIMMNMGIAPNLSSVKNFIPVSTQSGILTSNIQTFSSGPLDPSRTMQNTFQHSRSVGSIHREIDSNISGQKDNFSSTLPGSRTEKVVDNFLQSSAFKNEAEAELIEGARNLRTENNLLQLLLKHQEMIERLADQNQKLHKVLIEDLKIPPDKLETNSGTHSGVIYPCIDCFECRRRRRKMKT
ncbi:uncharacterized protein LOC110028644 [Phalaenopsis equestris]|uniref:uncharacterized protein LOC110028644 n=1 Tax=Phalaenopsis equestris TaxID=78828 RepID=UPI0009E4BF6E|nr:uncharacterized protein LOC110028644 [Phalaenopsis equestris]